MAESEVVQNLLDNKLFLCALVVVAIIAGQVVRNVLSKNEEKRNKPPK